MAAASASLSAKAKSLAAQNYRGRSFHTGGASGAAADAVAKAGSRDPSTVEAKKPARSPQIARGAESAPNADALAGPDSPVQGKKAAKLRDKAESERLATGAEAAGELALNRNPLAQRPDSAALARVELAASKEDGSKKEPKISLLDLRKSAQAKQAKKEAASQDIRPEDAVSAKGQDAKTQAGDSGRELVRELSLDARGAAADRSAGGAERAAPGSPASDFRALLAERMQEAWNGEIVQSARIVLRDGDSGTIRLRLRPESLGNVKIELNLADNNISGRIVVESDEAKSAFERNMSELSDAFRRGGFESASLQVSVGSGSGQGAGREGSAAEGPFFSERLRAAVDSGAEPSTAQAAYVSQGSAVDMLA